MTILLCSLPDFIVIIKLEKTNNLLSFITPRYFFTLSCEQLYIFSKSDRKGGIFIMETTVDVCITCGKELAIMERNRTECWECRYRTTETYSEEEHEELADYMFDAVQNTDSPITPDHS